MKQNPLKTSSQIKIRGVTRPPHVTIKHPFFYHLLGVNFSDEPLKPNIILSVQFQLSRKFWNQNMPTSRYTELCNQYLYF